jgi:hypothetical protein
MMRLARYRFAAVLAVLAGCISDPPEEELPVLCEESSDCDQAAGEVCEEGVCWGDPPDAVRFAAVLVPPAGRNDLAQAELPQLSISSDGTIAGVQFPDAVRVRGRVLLACPGKDAPYTCGDSASVGAQIRVERGAGFSGGPAYTRVVNAAAGVEPGKQAFTFLLPRDPDAEYRITIQPDDAVGGEDIAPGQIAPPRQITVRADDDREIDWVLGEPGELKTIRGCVQNGAGEGEAYADMRVVAFGRWTKLSPLERASSRSTTDGSGCFELRVPRRMLDEFDIVVQPATGVILPSFTLRGEFVRDPSAEEQAVHTIDPPLIMPKTPEPIAFHLPLEALGSAGGSEPVIGADVRFTTVFAPPTGNLDRNVEIAFTAQTVSAAAEDGASGVAQAFLYPGDGSGRTYLVSVLTPAGSQVQSVHQREVNVRGETTLAPLAMERRTAVRGNVEQDGAAVVNAPMEARPSALFRQLLGESLEQAVAELPLPTTTTDGEGGFVLWLDSVLVGEEAAYDIDVTPGLYSGAPAWSFEEVAIESSAKGEVDLGTRELPEASFARATVLDAGGDPVANAELHIYQLPAEDYCAGQTAIAPGECQPAARLRGVWLSDADGVVRVVLPDP